MIGRLRFAPGTGLSRLKRATLKQSEGEMFAAGAKTRRSRVGWLAVGMVGLAALVGSCRDGLAQAYTFVTATTVGASQQQPVPVTLTKAGTLASIEVLTQGISGLDYTELSSTFTPTTSYPVNTPGMVTVQFAPKYPGVRSGAVVLVDSGGNVLGMTLLSGTGTGPLSVMNVGELTTLAGSDFNKGAAKVGGPGSSNPTLTTLTNPINIPTGVAVDGAGNFYYSDSQDDVIYKVTTSGPNAGAFTTIAGTIGAVGYSGDGGAASMALLNVPNALLLDGAGNLYFSDTGNNVVREILGATGATVGKIVTVAGNGTANFSGDGGLATAASLHSPNGLAIDGNGNLYIADTANNVIRAVNAVTGFISTFAGSNVGTAGYSGDAGLATAAELSGPEGVYANADGSVYIADSVNNVVREVSASGIISTVAGGGAIGYAGDGQLATASSVRLNHPVGLAVNAAGDLLLSDSENNVIRKVSYTTGIIATIAGNGNLTSATGDGSDARTTFAGFNKIGQIVLEPSGTILLTDQFNFRVRQVSGTVGSLGYQPVKETNPSPPLPQAIENDGNAPLTVSAVTANTNAKIGSTTCVIGQPIPVGSGCIVQAIFDPTTVGNPVTGTISISSDSAVTPSTIVLAGESLSIFPTETDLTVSPNPAGLGAGVTMTAHVFNTGGTSNTVSLAQANAPNPPAVVTFYDTVGGTTTQIGTPQEVTGSTPGQGTATLVYSGLALGQHSITAVYAGDAEDATSTSAPIVETIDQQTSVALLGSPGPTATVFQNLTFTATVTPTNSGGAVPSGVVNFAADGVAFAGNVLLNGSGVAIAQDAVLGSGKHVITATYTGDNSNLGSTGTYTETVGVATAAISLGASTNSTLVTQPVTFTATLTGVNGNTPSGNVVFTDTFQGATSTIGTVAVNPATSMAVLPPVTNLGVGTHSVTATYQGDGTNYGPSGPSSAATVAITQVPTTVSLNPTNGSGVAGGSTSYSVLVTANSATNGVVALTGSIRLTTSGGALLGTGTLVPNAGSNPAQATATIKITNGGPGNVPVTAAYGGATDYAGNSASGALLLTQATTTTSLTTTTPNISATQTANVTAAVNSANGGIPTGTVSFTDTSTGTTYPSIRLTGNGNATLSLSTLTVGTHTFVANYTGDANDNPSTSTTPVTVTVKAVQPTMTLAPSATQPLHGQAFSLRANVVTGLGSDTATGSVTFTDSVASDPPVTVPLTNGSATFSSSTLTDGLHIFTVSYAGDANNQATANTASVTVLQTATLFVTGNPATPIAARQSVTFTATLTPLQQIPVTGVITFLNKGGVIGTGTLAGDVATFTTSTLPVGNDQITASFTSDGVTQSITSNIYTQVVNADGVTLTVAPSSNPATFGALLTLTATGAGTNGPLTGTVLFNDTFGGLTSTIGTGRFSSGLATATTTTLQPGVHSVVAAYQGDANDSQATSAPTAFSVKRQTNTVVTATPNPQTSLAPVTVTATVSNSTTTAYATGVVTFFDGTTQVGTGTLNGSGVASVTIQTLKVGAHSFTAQYAGDLLNLPSTSANPFAETVNLRQTTTDLSTTASSLSGGQQLTLISVVHTLGGPVVPTGQVVFYTGSAVLATQALDGNGVATVTVLLTTPTAALTAMYMGDVNYASSTSAVDNVTLGPAPDFNLVVNPSTISVVQDQHTTVALNLSSVKSFTDTLQLGCVGLPTAATCTFTQGGKTINAVTLAAGGTQAVSLMIDTGNPLQAGAQAKLERAERPGTQSRTTSSMVLACVLPGCFLLGLIGMLQRRFRNFGGLLLLLCLAGASAALSGCASLNINGTPTGTYTFRVTAVGATGISQATSVTLTVTK